MVSDRNLLFQGSIFYVSFREGSHYLPWLSPTISQVQFCGKNILQANRGFFFKLSSVKRKKFSKGVSSDNCGSNIDFLRNSVERGSCCKNPPPGSTMGPQNLLYSYWFLGGQNLYFSWFWGLMVDGGGKVAILGVMLTKMRKKRDPNLRILEN